MSHMSHATFLRRVVRLTACAAASLLAGAASAQTWVSHQGSFDPDGSAVKPFATLRAAVCAAQSDPDPTVRMVGGEYYETLDLASPLTLRNQGGGPYVTIGLTGSKRTTLNVQTYNVHLFGALPPLLQEIIVWFGLLENPLSWRDSQRASRIGALFTGTDHDVVVLQEVWDNALWNSILGASGQPFAFLADAKGTGISLPIFGSVPDQLHSGLGLLSGWAIQGASQRIYSREHGAFESLSSKSYLGARIIKDGFGIGIFNTHLQAGSEFDASVLSTRYSQMQELRDGILSYRSSFPNDPVIIVGDLNVRGSGDPASEYQSRLRALFDIGFIDAAREDYCNRSPNGLTVSTANELALYFDPATTNARLDYVLYAPSRNGNVRLLLHEVDTLDHLGPTALSESGLTSRRLSDHYGVRAEFDVIRR